MNASWRVVAAVVLIGRTLPANDAPTHQSAVQQAYQKALQIEQSGQQLRFAAFDPGGEWHLVYGRNGYWTSNVQSAGGRALKELNDRDVGIRWMAFTPTSGFAILTDFNGYVCQGVPPEFAAALQRVVDLRLEVQCVAFTPKGGWVILCNGSDFIARGIPAGAMQDLQELNRIGARIENIAFVGDEGSIIVFDNYGYRTRNAPAWYSAILREYNEKRLPILCVAATPSPDHGLLIEQQPNLPDVRRRSAMAAAPQGWPMRDAGGMIRVPTADEISRAMPSATSFDGNSPIDRMRVLMDESHRELTRIVQEMPIEQRTEFLKRHYADFLHQWKVVGEIGRP